MANNIDEAPEIFLINEAGVEQKLDGKKLCLHYSDGIKVTIEVDFPKRPKKEIVIRGYHGTEEFAESEKYVIFNLQPGGCNLVSLTPEAHVWKASK